MENSKECPVLCRVAAWLTRCLLPGVALIFLSCSLTATALAAAPDVWPTHNDPLGFSVRHPPNWAAEAVQNELIRVRSADGAMFVLVQPFFARDGETAAGKVDEIPTKLAAVLPNVTVVNVRRVSYQPDEVIAEISFDDGGRPGRALALCLVDGRSGMFYAIAAPAQTFDKVRPVLVDILNTFIFITPTAPPPATGGDVNFVTWREPNEGAFTLAVPQGWQVSGGLYRMNALDVRPDVQISSPDGQIFFRIGDQNIPPYTTPRWDLEAAGFTEGSWYSYMGVTWMVRRYVGGLDFAREYLTQHLPDGCADATITQERERDDLSQPINNIYARYNLYGSSLTISMGEIDAECQMAGQRVIVYCFAGTKLSETGDIGIWTVDYLVYAAASGEREAEARAILAHIANSYQPNLDWMRRQSELAGAVGDIVAQTGAEIREIMRQAFEASSQVRDDAARRWSNMILGMTDVRDPVTGEEWRVANGHNYYWRKGDVVVGTDIDRPNVDFTPLVEF